MKKFFSLVLALVMALSLTTVAWGADMTEADIQNLLDAGGAVTLTGNATVTNGLVVAAGKTVVLDLAGNAVSMDTSAAPSALITNNGTLTIKDSVGGGKLSYKTSVWNSNQSTSTVVNADSGVLTVEGGLIENTTPAGGNQGATYAVDNYGVLTISGGTFTSNRIAVRQVDFNGGNANTVTIDGGTFTGGTAGLQVHLQNNSHSLTTVINGGTFNGTYAAYVQAVTDKVDSSNLDFEIAGGTYNGAVYLYNKNAGSDAYPLNVTVSGGTFNNEVYVYTKDSTSAAVAVPAISGGTFATDVSDYLAPGTVLDNGVVKSDISDAKTSYNNLYLKGTGKGDVITAYTVNLGYHAAVAPEYNTDGSLKTEGNVAYFVTDATAFPSKYVQVGTLAEADMVVYKDAEGKVVYMYLAAAEMVKYVGNGTAYADFGKACGQIPVTSPVYDKTATYYTWNGILYRAAKATETGDRGVMVAGKLVEVLTCGTVADLMNKHVALTTYVDGVATAIECKNCGMDAVKAPNYMSIPKNVQILSVGADYWYFPAAGGAVASTDKVVQSAETFDAGIAMYVGMSVMAAAGSAVVLKKKD